MLKDEIIEKAKQKPFRVYFDMDGVCSEERTGEHDLIVANAKDFYLKKRPMKTMLRVMQELHDAGVEIGILSSCWYLEQADQKGDGSKLMLHLLKIKMNILLYMKQ